MVVWNIFPYIYIHILGIIIPTDFHIFQRGRLKPPSDEWFYFEGFINVFWCLRFDCGQAESCCAIGDRKLRRASGTWFWMDPQDGQGDHGEQVGESQAHAEFRQTMIYCIDLSLFFGWKFQNDIYSQTWWFNWEYIMGSWWDLMGYLYHLIPHSYRNTFPCYHHYIPACISGLDFLDICQKPTFRKRPRR